MDSDLEIQRLRDWRHKADKTLLAFEWRIKEVERVLAVLTPKLERIARADEIAEAVSEKLNGRQRVRFTRWQVLGGLVVALAAVADTVARFLQ